MARRNMHDRWACCGRSRRLPSSSPSHASLGSSTSSSSVVIIADQNEPRREPAVLPSFLDQVRNVVLPRCRVDKHCHEPAGGHTTEALALVSALDFARYTPRTYIISDGDTLSAEKAREMEERKRVSGGGWLV